MALVNRLLPLAILCALSGRTYATAPADHAGKLATVQVQGDVLGDSDAKEVHAYAGSRVVIDHEKLEKSGYRSLDDALQQVPSIKIMDETGTGVLPQIMLRGLYESRSGRVQVLEDGIPMSLAPYGQTSLSLFPVTMNQIDRIDVVRGGAAVQYGPNNVGGVINLVSKPIPQRWTTTLGERLIGGGAGHFLRDTSVSTGGYLTPNFGIQLDADWMKGMYWRDHSGTNVKNIRLRTEWWITQDKLLKAEVSRYVANMEMAGALSRADYEHNRRMATRPLDQFTGRSTRAAVTYQQDLGRWWVFDSSQFNLNAFSEQASRNFIVGMRSAPSETWRADLPPQKRQNAPRGFKVYGVEPRLALHMDNGPVTQQITVGVRAVRENIDFLVENRTLATDANQVVRNWRFADRAWSAYVSDAVGLFDDRLTLTPGVRYEYLDSSYHDNVNGKSTRNDIRNPLPGFTIGYKASPRWYVYADAQRSLRAPQVTAIIYGNNLDSELAWNYEAGVRWQTTAQTYINFDLYRIDFDKQIVLDNTTRTYQNIGRTRNQGFELEAHWQPPAIPGLDLDAGYSYLDASELSQPNRNKRVPYTSRNQFNLGATYTLHRDTTFALNSYYFSGSYSDAANTRQENAIGSVGRVPAYWIWNGAITHTLLRKGSNLLKGSIAVDNLFNRRYWFRGIDTSPWGREPAPGRTVTLGMNYTF